LPHQSRSFRSKGRTHREFAAPLCAARKQEVRHVDAGDQEHQDHRTENGEQRGLDAACDFILQRIDDEPVFERRPEWPGKLRYAGARDAVEFPFGLIGSEAGP